jgi:thiol:disulfide interchange protein DsbD
MEFSGNLFEYFAVFAGGVAVSFTPCVYPVMPVTAGVIAGANAGGTRLRGFVLSLIYVLGLSVSYCAMGAAAALTGQVFGRFQNSPAVSLAAGGALVLFALVLFDALALPSLGVHVKNKPASGSAWSVFLMGVMSGLIVGPCTAPVLGALLIYAGSQQNIARAVSLLFVFSYGVGFSLILVGTFSGLLARLPASGAWMIRIKKASGLVLLAAGGYYVIKAVMALM